ncbi:ribokinase [Flavitalea sp.]|nr:ribokinase [Flavitalea sp.]
MQRNILIVGSSNTDMVIKAGHLPVPGETILGGTFLMNPGGKGANAAVSAARLGANVVFICKTGNDVFGHQSIAIFKDAGIDVSHIVTDADNPSGVALITVDRDGENCIVVASGANATLSPGDLTGIEDLVASSAAVLMQLEIPLSTVQYVAALAFQKGVKVILNPAPACEIPDELLRYVSIITPNKTEAEMLTGIKVFDLQSAKSAAAALSSKGIATVIITMGSMGALVLHDNVYDHIPAVPVDSIDTTAAGDVFNGALAVALSEDKDIIQATRFACMAAAISVTKLGAQASAPSKQELEAFIAVLENSIG